MYQKILLPLDGSALAERAEPYAVALAQADNATLLLLRAVEVHTLPGVDPTEAQVEAVGEATAYLDARAAALRQRGLRVETSIYYDDAASAIADEAQRAGSDLIVMATHGRSGIGRWRLGSVADRVSRSALAPVLMVRSQLPAAEPPEALAAADKT